MSAYILRNPKIAALINILLALLLVATALFFIRDVLSTIFPRKENPLYQEKKVQAAPPVGLMDYALIMKKNPFGFPAGELKPISAVTEATASPSEIILIGTVAGRRDSSYAIFADSTGQQEVFRPGARVFGTGTLKKVEKASVTINSGGKDLVIKLSDIATVKEIKAGGMPVSPFGRRTGAMAYQLDQRAVQRAIEKPDQILTDARFVPYIVDGMQQGFILREVRPGGIYQSLGLRNEDILLRINEYAISNPEAALQAFTALKGIDRAELDIIRNDSKMTMSYQIR
jgi:type II secretion system protein C